MKNLRNDYCIRMFADKGNTYRPHMNEVNLSEGCLYATDAHIAAKVKSDLCVKKYEQIEKYPNAESVFKQHESIESKKIHVDSVFQELMKIEVCFVPKMIECGDCDGTGEQTCEYCDSEHDCKECSGEGKVESNELELSGEYDCILFNRKYKLKYLDMIIKTAIILKVEEIEISNSNKSFTIFKVGDFTILLMPVNHDY